MTSLIPSQVNGQREQLKDWRQLDWTKVYKTVRNLRRRIFRARKRASWKQLRRLQKLMLKCQANLLFSVRKITQINKGELTAGVDEEVVFDPDYRVKLVNQ
jgi:RNA-directed DNA polymerase